MALGEKSFFWDKPAGELSPEDLEYYEYAAQDLASVYETMYTTGICPAMAVTSPDDNPEDYIGSSLACNAGDGLNVVFSPGAAMIKGRMYLATLPIPMAVSAGATTDFFLRLDLQSEKPTISLQAKQRGAGSSIEQNLTHDSLIYDIAVATVTVPQGSIQTDLSMITDQRLNTTQHPTDGKPISGLMRSIPYVETKGIWEQWTVLKEQIEEIISDTVSGILPDMSVTTSKFAPDAKAPFAGEADKAKNGVYPLTHQKSGTTHQLTGLSGVSGTVSAVFTATAGFAAGDTVTVDGTPYTIQLSNGETAEDNLFVSGVSVPIVLDTAGKKVNFKAAGVGFKFNPAYLQLTTLLIPAYTIPANSHSRQSCIDRVGGNLYLASETSLKRAPINVYPVITYNACTVGHTVQGINAANNYLLACDANYSDTDLLYTYTLDGSLIAQKNRKSLVNFTSTIFNVIRCGENFLFNYSDDLTMVDKDLNKIWQKISFSQEGIETIGGSIPYYQNGKVYFPAYYRDGTEGTYALVLDANDGTVLKYGILSSTSMTFRIVVPVGNGFAAKDDTNVYVYDESFQKIATIQGGTITDSDLVSSGEYFFVYNKKSKTLVKYDQRGAKIAEVPTRNMSVITGTPYLLYDNNFNLYLSKQAANTEFMIVSDNYIQDYTKILK